MELHSLQKHLQEIQRHKGTLVAISPELPDNSLTTSEKSKLAFPVLSDKNNSVAKAFGLVFELPDEVRKLYLDTFKVDLSVINGTEQQTLPIPATYVVDRDSVVRYAFVNADYTQRAEPSKIIDILTNLE